MNYQWPHKENKRRRVYFSVVSPFQHSNYSLTPPSKVPQSKPSGAADSAELQQEQLSAVVLSRQASWWQISHFCAASRSLSKSKLPLMNAGDDGRCHLMAFHRTKNHLGFSLVIILDSRVGFMTHTAATHQGAWDTIHRHLLKSPLVFKYNQWRLLDRNFPLWILWISMATGQIEISSVIGKKINSKLV